MTTAEQLHKGSIASADPATPAVDGEVGVNAQGEGTAAPTSPNDYLAGIKLALAVEDAGRPRTLQSLDGIFGASDAGQCERRAVWTVTQQPWTDVPKIGKALSGTYLHAGILQAVAALYPERLIEHELAVTLPSGVRLLLHPDEIDPDEPSVTDLKTSASAAAKGKSGPSEQQWMQVNLQYFAALQNGVITDDTGTVRVLFVNSADLDEQYVWQRPFDLEYVHKADDWFQGVIYNVKEGTDGEPQWPEMMCRSYCPFYSRCRPPVQELNEEITSPDLREMVLLGFQARENRKDWERVEKHVISEIKGLSGRVGGLQVVSTVVNAANGPYTKVEYRGEPG